MTAERIKNKLNKFSKKVINAPSTDKSDKSNHLSTRESQDSNSMRAVHLQPRSNNSRQTNRSLKTEQSSNSHAIPKFGLLELKRNIFNDGSEHSSRVSSE